MRGEEDIRKAYECILQGDYEQAIDWFERAIEQEPNQASYHYRLSITCARSGKLKQAVHHAKLAVRLEPDNQTYAFHLGCTRSKELILEAQSLMGAEDQPEQLYLAIALLTEAASLDPLSAESCILKAAAHAGLQDYTAAVHALREALRRNPTHTAAQVLLEPYTKRLSEYINSKA